MNQLLLVEGKDFYAIGELCKLHFPLPKGFTPKNQKEFIKGNKGFDETVNDFINALDTQNLENIGLIVDADFKGVDNRLKHILTLLSEKRQKDFMKIPLNTEGVLIEDEGVKMGIWIMPNNRDNGYLEHFIEKMIEPDDVILMEAKEKVDHLLSKPYCRFTSTKKQKAIIYSWLAWQEMPGLPFGTAMTWGSLNRHSDTLKPFLNWVNKTFDF